MKAKQLKKTLQLKLSKDNYEYLLLCFSPLMFYIYILSHSLINLIVGIVAFIPLLWKPNFKIVFVPILIGIFYLSFFISIERGEIHDYKIINYRIVGISGSKFIVEGNGIKAFVSLKGNYHINDVVRIEGTFTKTPKPVFLEKNIRYILKPVKYFKNGSVQDVKASFINYISSGGGRYYNKYTPLVLLGLKTSMTRNVLKMASNINVMHLFVISGFHISMVYVVFKMVLKKMKLNEIYSSLFSIIPITVYMFFLSFPISASRAYFLTIFSAINSCFSKKKFKTVDLLGFSLILMTIIFPRSPLTISFVLTYIATFSILFINDMRKKDDFVKLLLISIFAYVSTIPIIVSMNKSIAIFGIFFATILSPIFVFIYLATIFLFPFKDLLNYIYLGFDFFLKAVNEISILHPISFVNENVYKYFYLTIISCFIITIIWNSFMVKKNI